MYCPSCGSEERRPDQYCRACGTDLRPVRRALERPDEITDAAVSARDEIGRAVAARIRATESSRELKQVAEDVLPQIEKFLESPEERRLRRVRSGVVTASLGLGLALLFVLLASLFGTGALLAAGAGLVLFAIGTGLIVNGLLFTVTRKGVADRSLEARRQERLDREEDVAERRLVGAQTAAMDTAEPAESDRKLSSSSVTEHTTHRLPGGSGMPSV